MAKPRTPKTNPFVAARLAAGFRYQQDAAQAAGVAQSAISELERGFVNPRWDTISRLSQLYNCDPRDLLPPSKLPKRNGPRRES